jgi:lactate dehydrogenase-like 2-hydroxyacid dehydrogenase
MHDGAKPWRVLVVGTLPDFVRTAFDTACVAVFVDDVAQSDLTRLTVGIDAVVVVVGVKVDRDFLASLDRSVKAIGTYSVGFDHIDVPLARSLGLAVLNTPDVLSESVAEVAIFLMIGAARRATESIDLIRSRNWPGWTPLQLNGTELVGKSVGIFGMGRIGRAIASRAAAFGMTIHYHNRSRLVPQLEGTATYHETIEQLLAHSDVLMLAAPATPDTTGVVDSRKLAMLRRGSILVNISRGSMVDDDALITALSNGQLAAAGLDVFDREPDIDSRYFTLPNVFMLPHIGSSTREARLRMGLILIEGFRQLAEGHPPSNSVG